MMNDENTLKLTNSFPKLYPEFHPLRPMKETPFFFECRDGWFALLWDLSVKLEAEIAAMDDKQKLPFTKQVKEKFGTLRFYMSAYTDNISAAIKEAEGISSITCEICGEPGILRGERWTYTLCEEHREFLVRSR